MTLAAVLAMMLAAQAGDRVILFDNANARAKPAADALIVCGERLGTELRVQGREAGWVRVNSCGHDAFIAERLTRDITDANRAVMRERLLRERLGRAGENFSNANYLLFLAASWASAPAVARDREAQARYALYELQALAAAAAAAEQTGAFRGEFAGRLGEQSTVLFYNEVGGSWMLRNAHIWAVHDRFSGTKAADDIAWFAAEHGVGGECEGYVPCMLSRLDVLAGAYLRRHPAGRHVDAALTRIAEWLDFGGKPPDVSDAGLPKGTVCGDAATPLAALRAAITPVSSALKPRALAPLQQVEAACR